ACSAVHRPPPVVRCAWTAGTSIPSCRETSPHVAVLAVLAPHVLEEVVFDRDGTNRPPRRLHRAGLLRPVEPDLLDRRRQAASTARLPCRMLPGRLARYGNGRSPAAPVPSPALRRSRPVAAVLGHRCTGWSHVRVRLAGHSRTWR